MMNTDPIIYSIVIPTKNEEFYLPRCLNAIKNSTLKNYEIIVVDNFSDDSTVGIARNFGCVVLSNPQKGAASSRNMGALAAQGEYIAFIDADCMIHPDWFSLLTEHFQQNKIIAAGTKVSPETHNMTWVQNASFHLNNRRGIEKNTSYKIVKWLGTSNILIKKQAFEQTKGFDENLIVAEDFDFCERLGTLGEIVLDKRIFTIHLREDKSLREVFTKERWRGQGSLKHWIAAGYTIYEAPSILVPVIFILLSLVGLVLLHVNFSVGIFFMLAAMTVPLALIFRTQTTFNQHITLYLQMYLVSATYLFARGTKTIEEFFDLFSS